MKKVTHPSWGVVGFYRQVGRLEERESPLPGCSAWGIPDEFVPAGATRGHWAGASWLFCRDGKARPVEPGTFPLVDGAPNRVGRIRAYGNGIVPQVAATFIQAVMQTILE